MTALDAESLPYPEMDIAQALSQLAPEDTTMVPWFTPASVTVDVPAPADVVPPAEPSFTPLRRPGASLASRPVPVPSAGRVTSLALLARVSDGLRNIPREGEVLFASAVAGVYGTEPQPNFAPPEVGPTPEPVPGWTEGVVRGLLIAALWEACRWYGGMDGTGCPDCEAVGGLCDWHAPKYARYWEYSDLHDFAVDAAFDATVLAAVADAIREGKADAADLVSPGSHLDLILTGTLNADRGTE